METILSKFNKIVLNNGNRVALKERNRQLTYEQLDAASNNIAYYLISKGLQKGDFVAIYLKRGIDNVISLLGIIKAGGVYVSLDPTHPNERNNMIIDDINASFVISNKGSIEKLNELQLKSTVNILLVEKCASEIDQPFFQYVNDSINDVCYTIFTS